MGPSLYEVYPCAGYYGRPEWSSNGAGTDAANHSGGCAPISSLTLDGKACTEGSDCWLIHSDMLHEAPRCTGLVPWLASWSQHLSDCEPYQTLD